MSDSKLEGDYSRHVREAAGILAVGLADELSRPLEALRDLLGDAVARLDHHAATAKGPDPLSYDDSKLIREAIADAYLKSAGAARIATDLAAALAGPGSVESCDLNELVENVIGLVRHRFSASTELFIDLGTLPPVSVPASDLVLAVARLLLHCADSTRQAGDAAVSVRTRLVGEAPRSAVHLTIAENGRGGDDIEMAQVTALASSLATRLGATFRQASAPDAGATFELRLPLGAR